MSTTFFHKVAAAVIVSCVLLATASADPTKPPNVVLIIADDQGWTDFGFMGHEVIKTPNLDRLASESAVFGNGYVPTSLCRASLATLLTGLYAAQHKICCNDPPEGVDRTTMHPFIQRAPTVPRLLGQAGYASLQTGKYWEGHYENAGFTSGMTTKGRHGDEGLVIGRQTMKPIYDFVQTHRDRPFFIWYAPMMPHEPHDPPRRLLERYQAAGRPDALARYYAMCQWFDETCGELLAWLDEHELRQDTLVAFVVDNGWIQDTGPPKPGLGSFAPKSKRTPYDGGVRTPVMLRWPGHTMAGRYDDLVSTIDLAPTILTACGVAPPALMPGLSLLDVAAGKGHLPRTFVRGEIYVHTCVDLDNTRLNLTHRWVRQGDWKLIAPVDEREPPELYNLRRDPTETNNLLEEYRDEASRLAGLLAK
ncbi:MAG TPA: sulfatase [Pirellulales bacterium]|nr:sulfatase [Pirellulales bacterium]